MKTSTKNSAQNGKKILKIYVLSINKKNASKPKKNKNKKKQKNRNLIEMIEPHILLFRRPIGTDPRTGKAPPNWKPPPDDDETYNANGV